VEFLKPRLVALFLTVTLSHGESVVPERAPLWGDLAPGPYAVGYRVDFARDRSRTWRVTRRYASGFTPDTTGRPVRISVWYPALAPAHSRPLLFGDYARTEAPKDFSEFNLHLEQRDTTIFALTVQPNEMSTLLAMPTNAFQNAPPAARRFPLVLIVGGLNAETTAQAVLAEFLASHGYVVATVPWTGNTENDFDAGRAATNLEATARDVEFAWSRLRASPDVDSRQLAVLGHSLGGIIAAIIGMRNANVSAVIGLDATYGFADATGVLTGFYGFAPQRVTAALLDLRKAAREQNTRLDLTAEHAFYFSDRTFITVQNIRHSEFTTYALISGAMHEPTIPPQFITPGWTRQTAFDRYQQVCEMVRDFLDTKLRGDQNGLSRLARAVATSPNATITHEVATAIPPSPAELVAIARAQGFDSVMAIVGRYSREAPQVGVVGESAFNNLGYLYLSQKRFDDALIAFRIVIDRYPNSVNAFDSYGDGLVAAGKKTEACSAYQRAVALASADTALDAQQRASLVTDETTKRDQTCAAASQPRPLPT
jgi:pimeloyl-ACP methyl ester carboxylesterase